MPKVYVCSSYYHCITNHPKHSSLSNISFTNGFFGLGIRKEHRRDGFLFHSVLELNQKDLMGGGRLMTAGWSHLKVYPLTCGVVGILLSLLVRTPACGTTMWPFELHPSMAAEF